MVMFLDQSPREAPLRLAERLDGAVVIETPLGVFELHSTPLNSDLTRMFTAATASDAKRGGTQDQ